MSYYCRNLAINRTCEKSAGRCRFGIARGVAAGAHPLFASPAAGSTSPWWIMHAARVSRPAAREPGKGERRLGRERGCSEGREDARERCLTALAGAGGWLQVGAAAVTPQLFLGKKERNRSRLRGRSKPVSWGVTKRYVGFSTSFRGWDFGIARGRGVVATGWARKV
jgi:hypothetical protein